jgi:DNA-binding phage protein
MTAAAPPEPKRMPRELTPGNDLGRRLLAFVRAKGYSGLPDAAEAHGLSYQQLYDIVSGNKDPRISTVEQIMEKLGGSMTDLYSAPTKRPKKN